MRLRLNSPDSPFWRSFLDGNWDICGVDHAPNRLDCACFRPDCDVCKALYKQHPDHPWRPDSLEKTRVLTKLRKSGITVSTKRGLIPPEPTGETEMALYAECDRCGEQMPDGDGHWDDEMALNLCDYCWEEEHGDE